MTQARYGGNVTVGRRDDISKAAPRRVVLERLVRGDSDVRHANLWPLHAASSDLGEQSRAGRMYRAQRLRYKGDTNNVKVLNSGQARSRRRTLGQPQPAPVFKRARNHDPESARQRRLGGAIVASGIGGGALATSGVSDIRRTSRAAQSAGGRLSGKDVRLSRYVPVEGPLLRGRKRRMEFGAMNPPNLTHAEREGLRGLRGAAVVHGRPAGKIGAGIGLLGLGATLAGRSHTRRWS